MSRIIRAADLFCGAGGTSQGAEQSGAAKVLCAVNHWQIAVETHTANFPHTHHINSRLDQVNPGECPKIDLLFASPECTHHSRARGGRPTSDQQRSGAWDLMRWIEHHRPSHIVVENVPEFREWGPIGDDGRPLKKFRGRFFGTWMQAIAAAGYQVDHRLLNAADYGAATSRTRLFVAARKGNRGIRWPEPSHSDRVGGELPGMGGAKRWRAAAEIIDWSMPCPSLFLRKVPLKDNTLFRIEAGLRRFVGPFVVELRRNMTARGVTDPLSVLTSGGRHHGVAVPYLYQLIGRGAGRSRDVNEPLPTIIATRENHGVAMPIIVPRQGPYDSQSLKRCRESSEPLNTITASHIPAGIAIPFIKPNFNEREGQQPRSHDLESPLPTVTSRGAGDLIVPYFVDVNHGEKDRSPGGRMHSIDVPLKTVTASKRGQAICVPIVITYYANGKAYSVADPLCTISTRDRCGIATAIIETAASIEPRTEGERRLLATMQELGVADVGFRMLVNSELSLAQGFPDSYLFCGNKGEVTRQIGNAVVPNIAEALTLSIAGAA